MILDMLEKVNLEKKISKDDYKKEISSLQQDLSSLQQKVKEAKLPVIILFDGWGAAGKGSLTVSYTHLDVYKRQVMSEPSACTPMERNLYIVNGFFPRPIRSCW